MFQNLKLVKNNTWFTSWLLLAYPYLFFEFRKSIGSRSLLNSHRSPQSYESNFYIKTMNSWCHSQKIIIQS